MRRVDQLIADIRVRSKNEEYGTNRGVQQNEIVGYLREAQARIDNLIKQKHPNTAIKEVFIDAISNQEEYNVPADAFINSNILKVEYSITGSAKDFYVLDLRSLSQRITVPGNPESYIPRNGKFLLNPIPQSSVLNGIRLNYQFKTAGIDIRRGKVSSSVINTGTRQVTTITLANDANLDATGLADADYICVVDRYGNFLMQDLIVSSYNSGTFVLSIDTSFIYNVGETLPNGSYITIGKFTTTHPQLNDFCERYYVAYSTWKVLKRDSNIDSQEQQQELQLMEQEIVDSYTQLDADTDIIPMISSDWEA